MMRTRWTLGFSLLLLVGIGCSEEEFEIEGTDAAGPGVPDSGTIAGGREIDLHVYQRDRSAEGERGAPIEGVIVALDVAGGRQQQITGADGRARFVIRPEEPEVTLTAARVGWLPVATLYRTTLPEIAAEIEAAGQLYVLMEPPPAPEPSDFVTITLTSTLTTDFCASVGPYDFCTRTGFAFPALPRSSEPLRIVAYSVDGNECPLALFETTLPNTMDDAYVELAFGRPGGVVPVPIAAVTAGAVAPMSVEVAARLPEDASSLFRSGLFVHGRFPAFVLDEADSRIRGGSCREKPREDGRTIDMTIAWFPAATGAPRFDLLFAPRSDDPPRTGGSGHALSWRALAGPPAPGTVFDVMDIPELRVPDRGLTLESTFETTPVAGATSYELLVMSGLRELVLWDVRSQRHQDIVLPALPFGYDRSIDWPAVSLRFRAQACDRPLRWASPWPVLPRGTSCSMSDAKEGLFERQAPAGALIE